VSKIKIEWDTEDAGGPVLFLDGKKVLRVQTIVLGVSVARNLLKFGIAGQQKNADGSYSDISHVMQEPFPSAPGHNAEQRKAAVDFMRELST